MNKSAVLALLVGAGVGTVIGLVTGNLAVWIGLGAGVGMVFAFLASRGQGA